MDETYLKVRGRWCYLYRAIDRDGNLIDAMLSERRDMQAAKAFFRSARATMGFRPDRVTTDGHGSYPRAIRSVLGKTVRHRTSAYMNNRLEQDHRGIKGRIRCMRGFKSHDAAHCFCRDHGELRDLLRPPTPSQPDCLRFPPPLPVRKRRPSCARDHAERVIRQALVENHQNSSARADITNSAASSGLRPVPDTHGL